MPSLMEEAAHGTRVGPGVDEENRDKEEMIACCGGGGVVLKSEQGTEGAIFSLITIRCQGESLLG